MLDSSIRYPFPQLAALLKSEKIVTLRASHHQAFAWFSSSLPALLRFVFLFSLNIERRLFVSVSLKLSSEFTLPELTMDRMYSRILRCHMLVSSLLVTSMKVLWRRLLGMSLDLMLSILTTINEESSLSEHRCIAIRISSLQKALER